MAPGHDSPLPPPLGVRVSVPSPWGQEGFPNSKPGGYEEPEAKGPPAPTPCLTPGPPGPSPALREGSGRGVSPREDSGPGAGFALRGRGSAPSRPSPSRPRRSRRPRPSASPRPAPRRPRPLRLPFPAPRRPRPCSSPRPAPRRPRPLRLLAPRPSPALTSRPAGWGEAAPGSARLRGRKRRWRRRRQREPSRRLRTPFGNRGRRVPAP